MGESVRYKKPDVWSAERRDEAVDWTEEGDVGSSNGASDISYGR